VLFGESTSRGIVSLGLRLGAFGCAAIGLSGRVILLVLCAFVRRLISQGITPRVMGFLRGHEYYCNEEILRPSRLFDECKLIILLKAKRFFFCPLSVLRNALCFAWSTDWNNLEQFSIIVKCNIVEIIRYQDPCRFRYCLAVWLIAHLGTETLAQTWNTGFFEEFYNNKILMRKVPIQAFSEQ